MKRTLKIAAAALAAVILLLALLIALDWAAYFYERSQKTYWLSSSGKVHVEGCRYYDRRKGRRIGEDAAKNFPKCKLCFKAEEVEP
ncbi:MAG: hypothetical protein PHI85_09210 [Victivallaceae bacterium]|nr:hypothetical protein [Victivallaceae bacterium]